jgi:hypothetical protein
MTFGFVLSLARGGEQDNPRSQNITLGGRWRTYNACQGLLFFGSQRGWLGALDGT